MRLQTVPARRGVEWVQLGFRAFGRRPLAFAALFATFMFVVFLTALLPYLGTMLLLALLPLVSLGFMIATRIAMGGGLPTARVFVLPLQGDAARRNAMIQLGIAYAVATFAVMWFSDLADGGAFEAFIDALPTAQSSPEVMAQRLTAPALELGLALRFGLAGLLSVPFWHAPALIHWDGHSCAKSLFSSTIACWRNRGAFTLYGLAWSGLVVAVGLFGSLLFGLLGMAQVFALAALPLSLIFTTVFYVSLYFTFADCFVAGDANPTEPAAGAD